MACYYYTVMHIYRLFFKVDIDSLLIGYLLKKVLNVEILFHFVEVAFYSL